MKNRTVKYIDVTEAQKRAEIIQHVKEYYELFHQKKKYEKGDRIPYGGRVYDFAEMVNLG